MRVLAVFVGIPASLSDGRGRQALSAIVKARVNTRVRMTSGGLEGDTQGDPSVHGDATRAVYAYPAAHYGVWAEEEGRGDLAHGTFGENLIVEGGDERSIHIGDRFHVGDAVLEVTHPRFPCWKLGARMANSAFPERFLESRRTGFFLQVLKDGYVAAGDELVAAERGPGLYTVHEVLELLYGAEPRRDRVRGLEALDALPDSWRRHARRVADRA